MKKRTALIAAGCLALGCFIAGAQGQGLIRPVRAGGGGPASRPVLGAAQIAAAAEQEQLVLVVTVTKVTMSGHTKGPPPSGQAEVAYKDCTMLKGPGLDTLELPPTFTYTTIGDNAFVPVLHQKVLVMGHAALAGPIIGGPPTPAGQSPAPVKTKLVVALVAPGTDENLATARKALGLTAGPAESPKAKLGAAVGAGELVFTATVEKARTVGRSTPPLIQVTMKEVVMLKGAKPAVLDCPYRPGNDQGFTPKAGQKVLCAAHPGGPIDPGPLPPNSVAGRNTNPLPVLGGNGPQIFLLVEATEANVAAARKALGPAPAGQAEK
jgi:hypothetical protein